ncbi:hypothetical protein RRG08_009279, partial [Elysia crispata]
SLNDFNV